MIIRICYNGYGYFYCYQRKSLYLRVIYLFFIINLSYYHMGCPIISTTVIQQKYYYCLTKLRYFPVKQRLYNIE